MWINQLDVIVLQYKHIWEKIIVVNTFIHLLFSKQNSIFKPFKRLTKIILAIVQLRKCFQFGVDENINCRVFWREAWQYASKVGCNRESPALPLWEVTLGRDQSGAQDRCTPKTHHSVCLSKGRKRSYSNNTQQQGIGFIASRPCPHRSSAAAEILDTDSCLEYQSNG